VLAFDPFGHERVRLEGYLPRDEFRAWLEMALGRLAFLTKKYPDAERWYTGVAENRAETTMAPEATYWRAVSRYKGTNDHTVLHAVAEELHEKYPGSVWQLKSLPWA
jgi:TolA-binding protein